MNLAGRRILVAGGAGFIGSHLVDALREQGCAVRVVDDLATGRLENLRQHEGKDGFEFFRGTITDPHDAIRALEGIEVVFHLACLGVRHSIGHPFENHRVNAEGTLLLLQESLRRGVERFVHCSSSEVYGTARTVPMPETHPTLPCTVYGASKLAGESYARAFHRTHGMSTVVIRPFNTYGPLSHHEGDAGEVIPKSIVRALAGMPILVFGDGSQTRDYTYVEDTARALVEAARCDALVGGTFNIGSNFEISINDLAERIRARVGTPEVKVEHVQQRPGDVLRLYCDPTEFVSRTGWKPRVAFDEGLDRTIAWFRARPEGAHVLAAQERPLNWL
ncbi:MAG: GDP-mannose 4,6-dehydratase [Elusimicrobiota bacterium]